MNTPSLPVRSPRAARAMLALAVLSAACEPVAAPAGVGVEARAQGLTAGGAFLLRSVGANGCADVSGASTADGAELALWRCNGQPNQRLLALLADGTSGRPGAGDTISLRAEHSGLCLDVFGGSVAAGAPVIQWPCAGSANQRFTVEAAGAGRFRLVASHSGLCVAPASAESGARLQQVACDATATAQRWTALDPAALYPAAETVQPLWDFYLQGQGRGPVFVEGRLCRGLTQDRTDCLVEVGAGGVSTSDPVTLLQTFLVPQGDVYQDLTVLTYLSGSLIEAQDEKVTGSSLRSRTWVNLRLRRAGDYTFVLKRGEAVLGTWSVKAR